MKIAVVGANGMLGHDLKGAAAAREIMVAGYDLPEVDITRPETLSGIESADVVINCAAYTRVDDAETEKELAWKINAEGAGNLAAWCKERDIRLIHVSTDYVFDGGKGEPYHEEDKVNPISVYGASKLGGEEAVAQAGGRYLIARTQSLYGVNGRSFAKAILGQVDQGKTELKVVSDQVSSPTYTPHLAEALLLLAENPEGEGIVHVASRDGCSWHRFAEAIVEEIKASVVVHAMSAAELKYPAPRPAYSILDTTRYRTLTGRAMPTWREGLRGYLKETGRI
ncbi:MAG TPA: dTDP-4-dehydrorhamnose reductase [Kiritimatiellia bacterium]|nr:dTDP-4-dehydrorhamnose reductase [Kiritimatiellia bacterium]